MFGKKLLRSEAPVETDSNEYFEVGTTALDSPGRLNIDIEKLNDFADTDRILKAVRNGSIVFVKIKGLKEKDIGELKRAVERLKKSIVANNGDIAGVEQEWLILTPESALINRSF